MSKRSKYNSDSKIKSLQRRNNERTEMVELKTLLPLPEVIKDKMKDGDILKFATTYFKAKASLANYGDMMKTLECSHGSVDFDGGQMLNVLNGFLILLDMHGKVLYVSEHVSRYLKYQPTDLLSKNIVELLADGDQLEFIDKFFEIKVDKTTSCEKEELLKLIQEKSFAFNAMNNTPYVETDFVVKMKCSLSKYEKRKGTIGYSEIHWAARPHYDMYKNRQGIVALCTPMSPSSILEIGYTDNSMFICRFNTDFKLTMIDPRLTVCLGYTQQELMYKNLYIYEHPDDHNSKAACTMNLQIYGRSVSKFYRLQSKQGQYVWVQSQAYTIYDSKHNAVSYVTYNFIISNDKGNAYLESGGKDGFGSSIFQDHGGEMLNNSAYAPVLLQMELNPAQEQLYVNNDEHANRVIPTTTAYNVSKQNPAQTQSVDASYESVNDSVTTSSSESHGTLPNAILSPKSSGYATSSDIVYPDHGGTMIDTSTLGVISPPPESSGISPDAILSPKSSGYATSSDIVFSDHGGTMIDTSTLGVISPPHESSEASPDAIFSPKSSGYATPSDIVYPDHGGTMIDNSALSVITPSPSGSSELSVYTNPSPLSSSYATSDTAFTDDIMMTDDTAMTVNSVMTENSAMTDDSATDLVLGLEEDYSSPEQDNYQIELTEDKVYQQLQLPPCVNSPPLTQPATSHQTQYQSESSRELPAESLPNIPQHPSLMQEAPPTIQQALPTFQQAPPLEQQSIQFSLSTKQVNQDLLNNNQNTEAPIPLTVWWQDVVSQKEQ